MKTISYLILAGMLRCTNSTSLSKALIGLDIRDRDCNGGKGSLQCKQDQPA